MMALWRTVRILNTEFVGKIHVASLLFQSSCGSNILSFINYLIVTFIIISAFSFSVFIGTLGVLARALSRRREQSVWREEVCHYILLLPDCEFLPLPDSF